MSHRWIKLNLLLCLGVSALAGCFADATGDTDESSGGTQGSSIAFAKSFKDYRTWDHVPAESTDPADPVHPTVPATVYISKLPASGDHEFSTGTLIVKEANDGDVTGRQVFAMAKRGGTYNSSGAAGWEWFELQNLNESEVTILWRGVGPPAGEMYAGDPNSTCNSCHGAAKANDSVKTTGLTLTDF